MPLNQFYLITRHGNILLVKTKIKQTIININQVNKGITSKILFLIVLMHGWDLCTECLFLLTNPQIVLAKSHFWWLAIN